MTLRQLSPVCFILLTGCLGPWDDTLNPIVGTADTYDEITPFHPRCTNVFPADLTLPVDPASTYLIGTVFDHTLDTHTGRYQSAQLAVSQANDNGGLEGFDFAMIHCTNQEEDQDFDELDKTAASVETARWLAEVAGVPAIVGPAASSRTEAVYNELATEFGTLVVSPSATSPSLTPLDGLESTDADPGLLWRTAPPDDIQGAAIAWDMVTNFDLTGATVFRRSPPDKVAVIHQTGAYGEGLQVAFTDSFIAEGGTTAAFPFSDEGQRSDAIANVANDATIDEVVFISSDSSDVIAFLQGADTLSGYDQMPIFLSDGARNADVLDQASGASARFRQVRGTAPANPAGPIYDAFAASYAAEYGGQDVSTLSFTAQSYDGAWLVIMGHAWATYQRNAEITGINIARGLRRVSNGVSAPIRPSSWNTVKAEFEAGNSVDVSGASGDLDYGANGETTAPIEVWTINTAGNDFLVQETFTP